MQNRLCCALLSLYQRESPVVAQYFAAQFLIGLLCVDAVCICSSKKHNERTLHSGPLCGSKEQYVLPRRY